MTAANLAPVKPLGLQMDLVSVAAIFGAFTWVVSDSIARNHLWTFHPSDLSWYALRLLIAVPLGQAIAVAWPSTPAGGTLGVGTGPFLAFVISMFSFDSITKILSSVAAKAGALPSASPDERNDIVLKLAGVDDEKARALAVEGVTTITQLIAVDPVRTSIRSGLPFEYVVTLIDAALLWRYLGTDLDSFREFGFIGASQVLNFADEQYKPDVIARAKAVAAAATELDKFSAAVTAATEARDAALAGAELQQAKTKLQNAELSDAERVALQQQQEVLQKPAVDRQAELDSAIAARDKSNDTLNEGKSALLSATTSQDLLLQAIENKTKVSAVGVGNVINQLRKYPYADFIRRLLGSAPAPRDA